MVSGLTLGAQLTPHLRALLCVVSAALAQTGWAEELGTSLDGLLAYAREHNPELRMRTLEAEAAHAGAGAASALPDPVFMLELMDITNAGTNHSASILPGEVGVSRYQITQTLPFFGKRALRGAVARHQAAQSDAQREATWLELENQIKAAYVRYYQAVRQARILDETRELYESLERLAVTRYGVGLVPQQEVVRAQSEITAIKVDLIEAEQRRHESIAGLNALLPRATDAPLAMPASLAMPAAKPSLADLRQAAFGHAPDLAREQSGIAAAKSSQALALRERYPDLDLGVRDTRPRDGLETWDLLLQVNIPLQQAARRDREAEAGHRLEAAQASLEAARARIDARLGVSYAAFESSQDKARLLRSTMLPQAEATLKSAEAGYETGKIDFNTLIEAQRQILRTRLALLDAEVETFLRLAELEQLTGAAL